ncbi:HD domain-containing phosphohydrolase [Sulfurimonas sp. C5]|uniref:response regulator n=1 Tax=Sulfurimonas sp. C5 TaxID=3036947 RepID=UPI002458D9F3|nr:HD domain-containing phosphohydrolase [Sulfurimonas sp. C5]MDH4944027.1 HD domain-containing phosphohydrolase [Sulfurimonas sp. C5]
MERSEILIIDDVMENVKKIIELLREEGYGLSYALNSQDAIDLLKTKRFDLILLARRMSDADAIQLCKSIKNTPLLQEVPLIFLVEQDDVENLDEGYQSGCIDDIRYPIQKHELYRKVRHHLEFYNYKKSLKISNWQNKLLLSETEDAQKEMVYILSAMIEDSNLDSISHIRRVADFAKQLAVLEGTLNEEEIKMIYLASPLYDIGKVFIEDSIVKKPEHLTDDEFAVIKNHPKLALRILKNSSKKLINAAAIIAYEHHENFDGTGYPRGLKGEEIHIYARIVAIVSVLDALLEKKAYKDAWSFEDAVAYIQEEKGKKFDPRLVNIFEEHLETFQELAEGE